MRNKSFLENRFNYFLSALIAIFLISPFFPPIGTKGAFPVVLLFYTFVAVFIVKTLFEDRKTFIFIAAVYIALFLVVVLCSLTRSAWADTVDHVSLVAHIIVLGMFLRKLFKTLFSTRKVNADSIKGGICIYFLFGLMWGLAYRLIHYYVPGSFVFNVPGNTNLFYFSFVTLTTMGYGDIIPTSRFTQVLAILEAATGQLFLAVYIARLMGMYIAGAVNKD